MRLKASITNSGARCRGGLLRKQPPYYLISILIDSLRSRTTAERGGGNTGIYSTLIRPARAFSFGGAPSSLAGSLLRYDSVSCHPTISLGKSFVRYQVHIRDG